jgi:hypothetical protein
VRARVANLLRHPLRLTGFTLSLLILLGLFYLLTHGIPAKLTKRILTEIQQADGSYEEGDPLFIQADDILLSPFHGWYAKNARIYSSNPDDLHPLLYTEALYFSAYPLDWMHPLTSGLGLRLSSEELTLSLGCHWERALPKESPFRTIKDIDVELEVTPSGLQLNDATLRWGGLIAVDSGGSLAWSAQEEQPLADTAEKGKEGLSIAAPVQTRLAKAVSFFEEMCSTNTLLTVQTRFSIDPNSADGHQIGAVLTSGPFKWNQHPYSLLQAELVFTNQWLRLNALNLEQTGGRSLSVEGSLNTETQSAQLHVNNTLSAPELLPFLPEGLVSSIEEADLSLPGKLDFNLTLGPAPLSNLLDNITLDQSELELIYRDVLFDPLRLAAQKKQKQIEAKVAESTAAGGPVEGSLTCDLQTGEWEASLAANINPEPVGDFIELWTGPVPGDWIRRFAFTNQPPQTHLHLSHTGLPGSFQLKGTVSGSDLTASGEPLDSISLDLSYSNRTFSLSPIQATRNNRLFQGVVHVKFEHDSIIFAATNQLAPSAVAHIIAPGIPTILDRFDFNGPIDSSASGRIDFAAWKDHSFQGTFKGSDIEITGVQVDRFESDIQGIKTYLSFTNATASLCNGTASGHADFDIRPKDQTAPYEVTVSTERIDLPVLLKQLGVSDIDSTKGRLSGTCLLRADAKEGFWESVHGQGSVDIADGRLAQLPLLKGFSNLMRSSFGVFDLFSMTTLSADYTLHSGRIHSDNIMLGGALLSAMAKGHYSPETGLNFRVRGIPLRITGEDPRWYQLHRWGAKAIKKGTAPLFNLFEMSLEGSLDAPRWRMLAIPKEFYGTPSTPEGPKPTIQINGEATP